MIQCNTTHIFLDYNTEADDNIPQIPKDRATARIWVAGLSTDKEMENF